MKSSEEATVKGLIAKVSIQINASSKAVWDALTKPALVKQYFFGTNVDTDWKRGSPSFFSRHLGGEVL
jgi:uncharacterized protein YndB with AHSA1/START domain